ncbi:MAG: LysE family transporter, partial [Bdellovibrionales bacterium]|nr:LysE family transporter [Bdellovibrionales bacterium]
MPIENWFAFVVASTFLLMIPGPTILTVISYSMAHGKGANIALIVAVVLGDTTALFFSLIGLGSILSASAFWFTVVKVLGGIYLLYLG